MSQPRFEPTLIGWNFINFVDLYLYISPVNCQRLLMHLLKQIYLLDDLIKKIAEAIFLMKSSKASALSFCLSFHIANDFIAAI